MTIKRVGANMQTIPSKWDMGDPDHPLSIGMRDLFLADEDHDIAKCDLKGADGWTIGAYLATVGEPTMLEDLRFGLKPAQIVALEIMNPGCTAGKSRVELKAMCVTAGGWQYFVSKCLIWGYCYTLGPIKAAELVFVESEGAHNLDQKQIKTIFNAIEQRYHPTRLHKWMERHMGEQKYPARLIAPNGLVRKFFGRNFGARPEVLGEALAHLPQVITTHVINCAMYKCWTDPENWHNDHLRIEPLHSVHDELVVQWHIEDREWAKSKIKEYFNNPILIAGQMITIPYDGKFGPNWAMEPCLSTL
jgi:hypothetical protein